MGYVIGIPVLAALAVVQSSLLSHLLLLDGRPDLVLLAVVGWALTGRSLEAIFWGFTGGLFLDLMSEIPVGVTSASLVLIAVVVTMSEGRFWGAHPLLQLAAVLVSSLLFYSISLGSLALSGRPFDFGIVVSRIVLPGVFLNVLLALPAAQLAEAVERFLFPSRIAT